MYKVSRTLLLGMTIFLLACTSSQPVSPLLRAEPEVGASLTRAPRTLRLYYEALPDVSQSSLRLEGPSGDLALRGLHTMAADDLMIEIMDPVTPGTYTVHWSTMLVDDQTRYEGSFQFSYSE